jgi:hypothetical protein
MQSLCGDLRWYWKLGVKNKDTIDEYIYSRLIPGFMRNPGEI